MLPPFKSMSQLPQEFTYDFIYNNRYNMPKLHHHSLTYELLCTNGFVKLYTINGRAYWIAQMENGYRTPDWKFHVSVPREQIPQAWDIIAKLFMEMQCKSAMKSIFTKDPSNVAKGREITVYIYKYDKLYGKGLEYNEKDEKILIELNKNMEQNGAFWMKFLTSGEEKLKENGIKIQGCADGDLKIGDYFSLRNESFVKHKVFISDRLVKDYEYPHDTDGWNKAGHALPFKLDFNKNTNKFKLIILFISIGISALLYRFSKYCFF